jgi:hypothetical protein
VKCHGLEDVAVPRSLIRTVSKKWRGVAKHMTYFPPQNEDRSNEEICKNTNKLRQTLHLQSKEADGR